MEQRISTFHRSRLFIFVLVFFSSCQKGINPSGPMENYQATLAPKSEVSYVNIPVTIGLSQLQADLNSYFPKVIYQDDSFDDDDLKIKILKEGLIKISHVSEDKFLFEAPVDVEAIKRVKVLGMNRSASTQFKMKIAFESRVFPTAEWKINTVSSPAGFEFITEPNLSIAGFSIPGKGIIANVIENYHGFIARQIDETIKDELDLQPTVLSVWNDLKRPRKVYEPYDLWLLLEPQDMLLSPLSVRKDKSEILMNVVMKTYIRTFVGSPKNQQVQVSNTLPPLKFVKNPPDGFKIDIDNIISFKQAESIANSQLLGKKFSFEEGKYEVEVEGIRLFGTDNNQLSIQAKLTGSVNGTVFMVGTPFYNTEDKMLEMKDLKFHLKTRNVLAKSASWLLQGKLEREMQESFKLPVGEVMDSIQGSFEDNFSSFESSGISGTVKLVKFIPLDVRVEAGGLRTFFRAIGEVDLSIKSKL